LLSAATWGGSDFVGGFGARRAPALLIVLSGHVVSLIALLALCFYMRMAMPTVPCFVYAAIGGFEGSLALALFYRALAMGAMGLTAALTGLLTALIPVMYSLFHEGLPGPMVGAGLAIGLAAIWLITHTPVKTGGSGESKPSTSRAALMLAALAGVGFGAQLILFKMASAGGILWTMTAARAAGVVALVFCFALMPPKRPWRGFWFTGIAAGALDTLGNLLYIQTTRFGRLDVAAVVCSLYPAGTILLAALVLREWPTPRQLAGMGLALTAVALLSI
jgi:drug/metabolite transporter (DMT)-like permease